jgi:hypothetical protein
MKTINFRTGLFRLWLLATLGWLSFGIWHWAPEIRYTYRYYINHDQLAAEHREIDREITLSYEVQRDELARHHSAAVARHKKELESEYGQAVGKAGMPLKPPEPDPRLAELDEHISKRTLISEPLSSPDPIWVIGLLAPPILALVAAFSLALTARWVWRGFSSK